MPGPPSARFVRNLEDVLDLYAQPKDPDRPLVCFDETSKALHEHFRPPTPPRPGQPARYDYQYDRMGTCNLFLCSAPLLGWRAVTVRTRRTAVDCAHVLKELVDVHFPEADKIVLVCDNLNTHTPKSLYKAFDKETAKRLAAKLEWHYTPPHGSWLNMAECELSVLTRSRGIRSLRPLRRPRPRPPPPWPGRRRWGCGCRCRSSCRRGRRTAPAPLGG